MNKNIQPRDEFLVCMHIDPGSHKEVKTSHRLLLWILEFIGLLHFLMFINLIVTSQKFLNLNALLNIVKLGKVCMSFEQK